MIPYPLGPGLFVWGDPIWVARSAGKVDMEVKQRELENALIGMTRKADAVVNQKWPNGNPRPHQPSTP